MLATCKDPPIPAPPLTFNAPVIADTDEVVFKILSASGILPPVNWPPRRSLATSTVNTSLSNVTDVPLPKFMIGALPKFELKYLNDKDPVLTA